MNRRALIILYLLVLPSGGWAEEAASAELSLSNDFVQTKWQFNNKAILAGDLTEKASKESLHVGGELFRIILADGTAVESSGMMLVQAPRLELLAAHPGAARLSEQLSGHELVAEFIAPDRDLHVTWRAILRDGSHYLRQQVTLKAGARPVPLKEIVLLDLPVTGAHSTGEVEGSPLATATMFFAVENPLSSNRSKGGRIQGTLPYGADLAPGQTFDGSQVIGFVREGQLRRDFLAYLERERAHPYRTFLTYNTWYDLGYFSRYDEVGLADTIRTLGKELVDQRQVKLDSFLLDDGWDDPATLWQPGHGFPNGFGQVAKDAQHEGAGLGFWLSPWGGYGQPKKIRLEHGKSEGFEIADGSFSMAGPRYFERFRSLCVGVIKDYDANQFKFDGIGSSADDDSKSTTGGTDAIRDFVAMLHLIRELRALKPDVYINQTTGTWPSPFWLFDADSIWRGGDDHSFAGTGTPRQQWITYRDGDVYQRVVSRTTLYPLSSLMLHGIIYARSANKLNADPAGDFKSEVRSFFGSGTQMQELYVTPKLLASADWDVLAESARWSRANADVLKDTHWIGGDPREGQVYGWASWTPRKGILTLRNPTGQPAAITLEAGKVFQLPPDAPREYQLVSPYRDQRLSGLALAAGQDREFQLKPFEVLVFDATPQPAATP